MVVETKKTPTQFAPEPPYALLRASYSYTHCIGMNRISPSPVDIALGRRDNRIFVLSRGRFATIFVNTWEDEYPLPYPNIGSAGKGDGQMMWATAIQLDSEENLFVCDEALNRISKFSYEGEFLGKWGEEGEKEGQLNRPSGMVLDSEDNFYISDTFNHRIQKFTPEGEFIMSFGSFGHKPGEFNMPWGVEVDPWGYLWVVDWRNDRIQKFTAEGEFVTEIGSPGSGNGEFKRPSGVTVDLHGDIYVADRENHRIQLFDRHGRYVEQFLGNGGISKSGIRYISVHPGPLRQRYEANLEALKLFISPMSVTVTDDFKMLVPDFGNARIQIFQKEAYPLSEEEIRGPMRSRQLGSIQ